MASRTCAGPRGRRTPGKHYSIDAPAPLSAIATEPLRATLHFTLTSAPGTFHPEPCVLTSVVLCRFPHQDCGLICTVPASLASQVGGPEDWIAGIGVHAAWTYTTPAGRIVVQEVSDALGWQLVILRISWDGVAWHVAPIFGHTPALPAADDAACDPALAELTSTTWSFMLTNPPPGAQVAVASNASPADGCVVVVPHHSTPPPVFLEHFGVLLTVNQTARNPLDGLPMASASEQRLSQQLIDQLHL